MKPIHLVAYSETHAPLFKKHFLPSYVDHGINRAFDIQEIHIDRISGEFGSDIFNEWMLKMMADFRNFLASHMGQTILSTGVDMRFYADISEEVLEAVEEHEFVSINDNYGLWCADFMVFKVTDRIISLFDWAIRNDRYYANNEFTLNHGTMELGIDVHLLHDDYFTVGLNNGGVAWNPGDPVNPPETMKLHHANFTVGAENKMKLLDAVLSAHQSLS
jgi:hypothetical protein